MSEGAIQISYPEPYPLCPCGPRLTWEFRESSNLTEGRWVCYECMSSYKGLPHPEVSKVEFTQFPVGVWFPPSASVVAERAKRKKLEREAVMVVRAEMAAKAKKENKAARIKKAAEAKKAVKAVKAVKEAKAETPKGWDDDETLTEKKRRGGPEKCSVCGGRVYANGNCFKCGTFLPGGRHSPPGGNKDTYEYLQMSESIRMNNFKWGTFG